jgi:hypothetical protein
MKKGHKAWQSSEEVTNTQLAILVSRLPSSCAWCFGRGDRRGLVHLKQEMTWRNLRQAFPEALEKFCDAWHDFSVSPGRPTRVEKSDCLIT